MHTLSWDLHIHPGPPEEGRWGDGDRVRRAAERAGVQGFVWKSHRGKGTVPDCQKLPHSVPFALPSITLNHGVSAADLEQALALGARWVWGPSRSQDSTLGWDLALPPAWDAMREILVGFGQPLVVATSHLDGVGRHELAEMSQSNARITCSVTHSLYLSDEEVRDLADLGAVFEVDLYTMFNPVRDSPLAPLASRAELCWGRGSSLYLTSDAGQAATGDPYQFVADSLTSLALPADMLERLAVVAPQEVASRVFAEAAAR